MGRLSFQYSRTQNPIKVLKKLQKKHCIKKNTELKFKPQKSKNLNEKTGSGKKQRAIRF
jgi:hypothetical protein